MHISPFTTTPGIAGKAYINTGIADEIIANFDSPYSTQFVYKILGLRGSGKSVEYKKVLDHFSSEEGWKVYSLPAGGSPMETLISALSREMGEAAYLKKKETSTHRELNGGIEFVNGSVSSSETSKTERNPAYYDKTDELRYMCEAVTRSGNTILVGIDDIAATASMIEFLSVIGSFFLNQNINLRMIATGLEKNIEEFTNEPHLSFFARPKALIASPLNLHEISYMYGKLLNVSEEEAERLAGITGGYAWGYQLLGDEFFTKKESDSMETVLNSFDHRMAPTYDLLWNSLTAAEKEFVKTVLMSETGSRAELEPKIKGYSQHRENLKKKHILDTSETGSVRVTLPRFREYVEKVL